MSEWLFHLPVVWMTLVFLAATYLVTWAIHAVIMTLATGDRLRTFKGISPGILPPLGILYALLVAFLASQVWADQQRAHDAVNREASALRAVVLLSARFPAPIEQQLRALVRRHIQEAATVEWPAMATQSLGLTRPPAALVEALGLALAQTPQHEGQAVAQRETVHALQEALDARRQRIIISRSTINWVKWWGLILEAILTLVAIGMVHSDNRFTASVAMGTFATAAAVAALMVASHARPFSGEVSVGPDVLLQVMPENGAPDNGSTEPPVLVGRDFSAGACTTPTSGSRSSPLDVAFKPAMSFGKGTRTASWARGLSVACREIQPSSRRTVTRSRCLSLHRPEAAKDCRQYPQVAIRVGEAA